MSTSNVDRVACHRKSTCCGTQVNIASTQYLCTSAAVVGKFASWKQSNNKSGAMRRRSRVQVKIPCLIALALAWSQPVIYVLQAGSAALPVDSWPSSNFNACFVELNTESKLTRIKAWRASSRLLQHSRDGRRGEFSLRQDTCRSRPASSQ